MDSERAKAAAGTLRELADIVDRDERWVMLAGAAALEAQAQREGEMVAGHVYFARYREDGALVGHDDREGKPYRAQRIDDVLFLPTEERMRAYCDGWGFDFCEGALTLAALSPAGTGKEE